MSETKQAVNRYQQAANLEAIYGEIGVIRQGYQVRNLKGDLLGQLSEEELRFVQEHVCKSDCRRIGCLKVGTWN